MTLVCDNIGCNFKSITPILLKPVYISLMVYLICNTFVPSFFNYANTTFSFNNKLAL